MDSIRSLLRDCKPQWIFHLAGKLKDESVMDQAALDAMDAEIHAEIEEAVKFADESPDPEPDELFTDVLVD